MGAMDAALIHMRTPPGPEKQDYCYDKTKAGSKCGFVLQFIVDHRLLFRAIHLDAPGAGTRIQIFQVGLIYSVYGKKVLFLVIYTFM